MAPEEKKEKVVGLFGPVPQPGEVREDVVEALRTALQRAENGEIIGICLVEEMATHTGAGVSRWIVCGYTSRSSVGSLMEMVVSECHK